jgi:endonuclease YncB( thermonuclease family)
MADQTKTLSSDYIEVLPAETTRQTGFTHRYRIPFTEINTSTWTTDGDTVTVLDAQQRRHRIRLLGIDAPEQNQAFGQKSKQSLSEQVFGHEVTVESTHKDRFDRLVGKLWLQDVDVNLVQIQRGMAWHFKHYARDQLPADRSRYDHAEQQARQARLGLWQDTDPMPPWQFRRQ